MKVDAHRVLERRRAEQRALVGRAERFAGALDPDLGVAAVVVFGSVARSDFNLWSDVDVLVFLAEADDDTVDRVRSAGRDIGLIAPVACAGPAPGPAGPAQRDRGRVGGAGAVAARRRGAPARRRPLSRPREP